MEGGRAPPARPPTSTGVRLTVASGLSGVHGPSGPSGVDPAPRLGGSVEDGQRPLGRPTHCATPAAGPRSGVPVAVGTVGNMAVLAAIRSGADALHRLARAERWAEDAVEELAAEVVSVGGIDHSVVRQELCSRALADPRLPALPPRLAAEVIVRLLGTLAPVRGVSVWMPDGADGSVRVCTEGAEPATVRAAADAVLSGGGWDADDLVAVSVRLWRRPAAALVLAVRADERHHVMDPDRRCGRRARARARAGCAP